MSKIQVQGVHHIAIRGSTRQSAIDFWEGLLGMPFVMDMPSANRPADGHLYFDSGDGSLITVFTKEDRSDDPEPNQGEVAHVDHLAFRVSRSVHDLAARRLEERGIEYKAFDRVFMDAIYFRGPNGLLVELSCFKFDAPEGMSEVEVLTTAHRLRVESGADQFSYEHVIAALKRLTADERESLSP